MTKNIKNAVVILVTVTCVYTFYGCSNQKAEDIVINEQRYQENVKKDNPYTVLGQDKNSTYESSSSTDISETMREHAEEYTGGVYAINDDIHISDLSITITDIKYSKDYECLTQEEKEYITSDWIQKGGLSNYASEKMSLVFVHASVKNTSSSDIQTGLGQTYIGNYYDTDRYLALNECVALYPSSYAGTTHCLYDDISAYEEKEYLLVYKVMDKPEDGAKAPYWYIESPCIQLSISQQTQDKKAPLVRLDNNKS